MGILDLIFPKFCVNCKKFGDYVCPNCFIYLSFDVVNICAVCSRPSIDGSTHPGCFKKYSIDGTFVGIEYNSIAKKLIYRFKYRPYISDLNKFLTDLLFESLIQKEDFNKLLDENFVFVPIPLSSKKERSRGYNQSELLAQNLGRKFGLKSINLLKRVKETKVQAGLTKKDRRENLANAFSLETQNSKGKIQNIFLVDDILTTGATFDSAAHVLKRAGVKKVYGIALAKER